MNKERTSFFKTLPIGAIGIAAILAVAPGANFEAAAETLPYQDESLSDFERAADMVSRMTLAEKINQIGHQTYGISRLGLKDYNYWNEAIHGVARSGIATQFPVSKALSSAWDTSLMFDVATAISDEARVYNNTKGKGLIYWCPTINMSRDPRWGRDEENYGEDPYLTGTLAVQYIKGMQGDDPEHYKLIATAKHFAANNYEKGRHSTSSDPDTRSLREYYLPAFEMAVKEGNVRSVMSAYNRLNGTPCGANHMLQIDILRDEWGFDGFVTSDCGAVDDIFVKHGYLATGEEASAAAITNGMDLNCGDTFQKFCKSAIEKELMTEKDLDLALTRVLAARFSVGEFDNPAHVSWTSVPAAKLDCSDHRALALKAARESIVLLKNDNDFLPLSKDKTVAVIGPLASILSLGGYSGTASEYTTPLQGICDKLDFQIANNTLEFENCDEQNVESGSKRLTHETNGSSGNLGYIFNNDWIAFNEVDFGNGCNTLDVYSAAKNNHPTILKLYLDQRSGTPAATVTCPTAGSWSTYKLTSAEVDPEVFKGKHKLYVQFEGGTNGDKYCANMDWMKIYDPNAESSGPADAKVFYAKGCDVNSSAETDIEAAVAAAKKADVVIFCAGTNLAVSDESNDRTSLDLPGDQQKVLEAVYAVNPNVVLLLQTCSSVTIPWAKENIPAIVEAWYGGQAQGEAIADVIYGDYNPSGKLTSTWYASRLDLPASMLEYNIRANGYTYMYHKKTPLYPFGYGLSYTDFEYSDFSLSADRLEKNGEIEATAMVKNTGDRAGAEIVQLYAKCHSDIERPQLQLVGFARVELEPGEEKPVSFTLRHDQLAYYNLKTHTFDVEEGKVTLSLAASSADIRDSRDITTEGATVKATYRTEQSGVDEVVANRNLDSDKVYDLSGRYLCPLADFERLQPGFYIAGGRKVCK